jgi:hypothetical protein
MKNFALAIRKDIMLTRYHLRKRKERAQQILKAKTFIPKDDRFIHLIVVMKKEYLKAAIRCVNSIWFHSPQIQVVIHIDEYLSKHRKYLLRSLDREDRVIIKLEETFGSWQELKLNVILNELGERDAFSDADLYWNIPIPELESGLYFAAEKALLDKSPYAEVIKDSGIRVENASTMANSSFISVGKISNRADFVEDVQNNFRKITNQVRKGSYEETVRAKILRLSEQIALSISINKRGSYFSPLKTSDKPMDGGAAESYYLGTTKGWV